MSTERPPKNLSSRTPQMIFQGQGMLLSRGKDDATNFLVEMAGDQVALLDSPVKPLTRRELVFIAQAFELAALNLRHRADDAKDG